MLAALYRLLAETERAIAQSAADAGDDETARVALGRQRAFVRLADEASRGNVGVVVGLQRGDQSGNLRDMNTAERVRHSQGTHERDELVQACNRAHLTLRSLAEQLRREGFRVSYSLLSQARRDIDPKPIRQALARRIAELTGFAATGRNWPGGWVEE